MLKACLAVRWKYHCIPKKGFTIKHPCWYSGSRRANGLLSLKPDGCQRTVKPKVAKLKGQTCAQPEKGYALDRNGQGGQQIPRVLSRCVLCTIQSCEPCAIHLRQQDSARLIRRRGLSHTWLHHAFNPGTLHHTVQSTNRSIHNKSASAGAHVAVC